MDTFNQLKWKSSFSVRQCGAHHRKLSREYVKMCVFVFASISVRELELTHTKDKHLTKLPAYLCDSLWHLGGPDFHLCSRTITHPTSPDKIQANLWTIFIRAKTQNKSHIIRMIQLCSLKLYSLFVFWFSLMKGAALNFTLKHHNDVSKIIFHFPLTTLRRRDALSRLPAWGPHVRRKTNVIADMKICLHWLILVYGQHIRGRTDIISLAHYRPGDKEAIQGSSGNSRDKDFEDQHPPSTQLKHLVRKG